MVINSEARFRTSYSQYLSLVLAVKPAGAICLTRASGYYNRMRKSPAAVDGSSHNDTVCTTRDLGWTFVD